MRMGKTVVERNTGGIQKRMGTGVGENGTEDSRNGHS